MTRVAEIRSHISSMDELLDIVGAMRSLAGMRVQEAQRSLEGVRRYAGSMAAAIGAALQLMPRAGIFGGTGQGCRILVLCMAEHGFVGGFNERLVEAARATLKKDDILFVLGSRGAALAAEHKLKVDWTMPMATRLASAPQSVNTLATELFTRIARGDASRVEVMFYRNRQAGGEAIERLGLLPLDMATLAAAPSGQPPLHNLEPHVLLEKLIAEYIFALLTEAAIESISSENAARFAAMEAAHDNVSKQLDGLRREARLARQEEITTELLDIMTGVEALN